MAGKKTSVYLTEQLAADVAGDSRSLPEIIAAGLARPDPPGAALESMVRRVVREELARANATEPGAH